MEVWAWEGGREEAQMRLRWPWEVSWNSRCRGSGEARAGWMDGRQVDVGGHEWMRPGRSIKAQDEQIQMMDTMDGRTVTSRRTWMCSQQGGTWMIVGFRGRR